MRKWASFHKWNYTEKNCTPNRAERQYTVGIELWRYRDGSMLSAPPKSRTDEALIFASSTFNTSSFCMGITFSQFLESIFSKYISTFIDQMSFTVICWWINSISQIMTLIPFHLSSVNMFVKKMELLASTWFILINYNYVAWHQTQSFVKQQTVIFKAANDAAKT